jgi:hypothetical protein
MAQALCLSSGLVAQIGLSTLNFSTADPAAAGTLALGGPNATQVNVGVDNATTGMNVGTGTGLLTLGIGTGAIAKTISIGVGTDTIHVGPAASNTATIGLHGSIDLGDGTNGIHFAAAASPPTLAATGTGVINLNVNATRRWAIDGTLVGASGQASITAANFDKLFDGSLVTTHGHSGLSGADVTVPVTTDGSTTTYVVYATSADAIASAKADAIGTSKLLGVKTATGKVMIAGVTTCTMEGALTAAIGDDLYLSNVTAGRVTNVAPTTGFLVYVGQAKTAGASPSVYVRPARPLAL